jgi:uncharacterized glyoxalase superfamily protein PhnB
VNPDDASLAETTALDDHRRRREIGTHVVALTLRDRRSSAGRVVGTPLSAGVSECILSFEGDVDEIVRRAQAADATIVTEPAQQPWGYTGAFADADGQLWMVTSPPAR